MNVTSGIIYDVVPIHAQYGYYGNVAGVSANALYNKYITWFVAKYGTSKNLMKFSEWIVWAKNKGLVLNAGGAEEPSEEVKAAAKAAMGTGKKVAIALLVVAAVWIGYNMILPLTSQPAAPAPAV